ncbi:regulatory protein RecX [Nitrospira lenta]|uniref:Regulatory protein RecX n=1 Tax=Nitrospira lenta TaxID=1436998 RepID=A0A330LA29_9BACT|nr:regulatory protein RecX [Nitrospira lenta]SPP66585.1 Regulatory protein RecX [Nitrospira lenta]
MGAKKRTPPSSPEEWMHLAVRYLARWDRTVAQVEQFLLSKGASATQAKQTISRLSDLRYLDDRAYAGRWIESRLTRQPMGRERLLAKLQSRGIGEAVAERAVQEALREIDEDTLARQALKGWQRKRQRVTVSQAVRLLRQWGFEEETIERTIRACFGHEGLES